MLNNVLLFCLTFRTKIEVLKIYVLGDFAIYLNNGLSKCKALIINLTAACCSFIGLYVALALSEDPGVRTWLLSFVAGMFLYISFVDVVS